MEAGKHRAAENGFLPLMSLRSAMMITFRLTKKDFWRSHPHAKFRSPVSLIPILLRLFWVPVLLFCVCDLGGLRPAMCLVFAIAVCLFPLIVWGLMIANMTREATRLEAAGGRIAEIGNFDFRYGKPPTAGYYHHWSTFSEVAETPEDFIFILIDGRKIIVPRSAFRNEDEAQTFLTLARERRQTAELKLHYSTMGSGGVWPPPPRIGA